MKKALLIASALAIVSLSLFAFSAEAVSCPTTFPTALSNWYAGCTIPSSWANALEQKIGITGSASSTSLDYEINTIFTAYGSEKIASSALTSVLNLWLQTANNLSDLPSTSTARTNLGLGTASTHNVSDFLQATNNLADLLSSSTARTNLGLGSAATFNSGDFLSSSTNVVNKFNGSSGTYNLYVSGPGLSIATGTASTTITYSSSSLNLGTAASHPASDFLSSSTVIGGGGIATSSPTTPGTFTYFSPDGNTITGAATLKINTSTNQIQIVVQSGSGSQSVGGGFNVNGTNATTSAVVFYDNQGNQVSGQAYQATCDTAFASFDCFVIRGLASDTTALDIQSNTGNKGALKIDHSQPQDGSSDANAAGVSIALNGTSTSAMGLFIDSASGTLGNLLEIRNKGVTEFRISTSGVPTFNGLNNGFLLAGGSSPVSVYGGSNPCSASQAATGISATGTIACGSVVTSFNGGSGAQTGVASIGSATGTVSLNGTANEVNVATTSNSITLSTPQAIGTGSSPTFGSLTVTNNTTSTSFTSNTTTTTQIVNFNGQTWIPANFSTAGCLPFSSTTTFDGCAGAIYASFASSSYNTIRLPCMTVTGSQWTNQINFNRNGVVANVIGSNCTTLIYGGAANASSAIVFNNGNPTGHLTWQVTGFSLQGSSTLLAAGAVNTATTTGIVCGGSNGCVGANIHDINVNGFGRQVIQTANAYMNQYNNIKMSGGDATSTINGYCFYEAPASNSGELTILNELICTDPGNSTTTGWGIYISDGAAASTKIGSISLDDATLYDGTSDGLLALDFIHVENPAYATYGQYIPIYATSSQASQLSIHNLEIANDANAAGTSFATIIKHGVTLTVDAWHLNNYGGQTVTAITDHSLNNGSEAEKVCGGSVSGGNLTNIIPNQAYSAQAAISCWEDQGNSWPYGSYIDSSNVVHFRNGNGDQATMNSTGAWTFSNNNTAGGPYNFFGSINATGTITASGAASSSIVVGASNSATNPGCFETFFKSSTTQIYIYPTSSGAVYSLIVTSTNPGYCK